MSNHIFLVGPMGVGKTTIGRKLARELGLKFVDCDQAIETKNGVSVATIFEIEGEQSFRLKETAVLEDIVSSPACLVSTGGGVVLQKKNVDIMRQYGKIIYLQASFSLLWHRLKDCKKRPLLQVESPKMAFKNMLTERDPLYKEAADVVIRVEANSMSSMISQIKQLL